MQKHSVSQLPVAKGEMPIAAAEVQGSVSELFIMERAFGGDDVLSKPVEEVMAPALETIGVGEPSSSRCSGSTARRRCLSRRRSAAVGHQSQRPAAVPPSSRCSGCRQVSDEWAFETKAIHVGQEPDPATGAVTVPVFQTSTYAQDGVGKDRGYEYSRTGNPTRTALETSLAALEAADFGRAFASGMAAEDTILRTLKPGDHIIMGNDAYGGTYRLITRVVAEFGVTWSAVDLNDSEAVAAAITPQTRMIWTETPTNPMLGVVDIEALAAPLMRWGNVGGRQHVRDAIPPATSRSGRRHRGALNHEVRRRPLRRRRRVRRYQQRRLRRAAGVLAERGRCCAGPMDCYLLLRGLKTLACADGQALRQRRGHRRVLEPATALFLRSSTRGWSRIRATKWLLGRCAGSVAWSRSSSAAGAEAAHELVARTEVFTLAESLGAVESLIEVPAAMTHLSVAGLGVGR